MQRPVLFVIIAVTAVGTVLATFLLVNNKTSFPPSQPCVCQCACAACDCPHSTPPPSTPPPSTPPPSTPPPKLWPLAAMCKKPSALSTQAAATINIMQRDPDFPSNKTTAEMQRFCSPAHYFHFTNWSHPIDFCIHNPRADCCVSRMIAANSFWEMDYVKRFDGWLQKKLAEGIGRPAVMLDVGANMGQYGIVAALRGVRVFMWEAMPATARIVWRTVQMNHLDENVTIFENGISDFRGAVDMTMIAGNTGAARINVKRSSTVQKTNVATVDDFVDTIVERSPRGAELLAMKVDIEGQEMHMFVNASRFFEKLKPKLIMMEVTPYYGRECSFEDMIWFLISNGYQVEFLGTGIVPSKSKEACVKFLEPKNRVQSDIWAELMK